jgi:hypothetical protein
VADTSKEPTLKDFTLGELMVLHNQQLIALALAKLLADQNLLGTAGALRAGIQTAPSK